MKPKLFFMVKAAILSFLLFSMPGAAARADFPLRLPDEAQRMRQVFAERVTGAVVTDEEYLTWISQDAALRFLSLKEGATQPQYFLYVDRNPNRQIAFVGLFNAADASVSFIGWDRISSGNEKRKKFFITPTGVFRNSPEVIGYRALGTKNSKGWRGLGAKGSRVWDFGWQKTLKNGEERLIRLLLHATDPDFGEARLGTVDSQGCVRVSARFNWFLDHYGLLDREYEVKREDKRFAWLLKKDRQPVLFAGQYLVVGDSADRLTRRNSLE